MKKRVIILGAGISGLAHAWYLKKRYGKEIELNILEKEPRAGGWIHTHFQNGFLFEQGPRGFRPQEKGGTTLELVRDLGLEDELVAASAKAMRRYLWIQGRLIPIGLPLLLQCGLLTAFLRDFRRKPSQDLDETIASFCTRHCGKEWAETLIAPLVRGVFCGDSRELSMRSCFPALWDLDAKRKSVMKAMMVRKKSPLPPLFSFKRGMETLPKTLAEKLAPHLLLHTPAQKISVKENRVIIALPDRQLEADLLISTLPVHALLPIWQEAPALLRTIEYQTLALVNFGFTGQKLTKRGYGFLIPPSEQEEIYGMTWDSEIFPQQNQGEMTRISVLLPSADEAQLLLTARKALKRMLKIEEPAAFAVSHAVRAIPQYTLGHEEKMRVISSELPSCIRLAGTLQGGVGVNDCIAQAHRAEIQF
jgi:protoporphyrinogen/coproporphyrinogen III oxidase